MLRALALCVLVLQPGIAPAAEPSGTAVGSELPPRVRALLLEEMNSILDATGKILGALVRGQDSAVAEQARAIHDSFILKQEMTEADRKALKAAVPAAFVERDRAFHELTARLAEAARKGNGTLQEELFGEMVGACRECHAEHAQDRFPGLAASE